MMFWRKPKACDRCELSIGFDRHGIVVSHGDDAVITFCWSLIFLVRGWRDGSAIYVTLDLPDQRGSIVLTSEMTGFDQFMDECAARLKGWQANWRSRLKNGEELIICNPA